MAIGKSCSQTWQSEQPCLPGWHLPSSLHAAGSWLGAAAWGSVNPRAQQLGPQASVLPAAGGLHLHGRHTGLGTTGLDLSPHSMISEAKVKGKSHPNWCVCHRLLSAPPALILCFGG